jgi:membrane protein YqaA with SNARE-associated domain
MMPLATVAIATLRPVLWGLAAAVPATAARRGNPLLRLLLSFGIAGVFLVSIVDSSFVPLPVPGLTDLMIVVLAAQHANLFLLVGAATFGSFLGGFFSYKVGQSGGLAFLEKHVPPRIFKPVCSWMEHHAILSVALPAVLPPPMPLSPFVLAAGALKMSRNKFLTTFTISRFLRHTAFAALGVYFGPHVLRLWNRFSHKYGAEILIAVWSIILISLAIAFWKLYKTSREMRPDPGPRKPSPAEA